MKKRNAFNLLLASLLLLLISQTSFSQTVACGYTFSQSSGAYTEITGGTVVNPTDDEGYGPFPIGFNFVYNGSTYSTFGMQANGFVSIGYAPLAGTITNVMNNLQWVNVIAGLNTDMDYDSLGTIRYETSGSAPNRVLTVQWKGSQHFSNTTDRYNLQIKLYETSNNIQVVYGTLIGTTTQTAQVGLKGASNSDFNIRTTINPTTPWNASVAGNSNTSVVNLAAGFIPDSGRVYQWAPTAAPLAPLNGTYTISSGGNYTSFTAAITDLNCRGISGPVTFNVAAGQVFDETTPPPIITTGTASNPIIFQKSGAGANPILRGMNGISNVQTTSTDACIQIYGADYITFNGIDAVDHPSNATNVTQMEFGYLVRNMTVVDGCQNVTIKNCSVDLRNNTLLNTNSVGIGQTASTSFGNGLTPSAQSGANNFNKYYNVVVTNCYFGIRLRNGSGSTIVDDGNEVGTELGGVTDIGGPGANSIGGSTLTTSGILAEFQANLKIFNCRIRNVTHTSTAAVHGIYLTNTSTPTVSTLGTCQIYNNEISDINRTTTTTASTSVYGIRVDATGPSTTNIYNNVVYGLTYSDNAAASATLGAAGIGCVGSVASALFNVYYNSVSMNITGANSTNCCLRLATSGTFVIKNNALSNQSPTRTGVARNHSIRREAGTIDPSSRCNVLNVTNDVGVTGFTGFYTGATTTDRNGLANWQSSPYTATPATFDIFDMGSSVNNPNFTSATNLTLTAGSSCANSGDPIAGFTTDKLGFPRNGTNPDIGAFEDAVITTTDSHGPRLTYTPTLTIGTLTLNVTDNVNGAVANARLMVRVAGSGLAFTELAPDVVPGTRNGDYVWNASISALSSGSYEYYVSVRDGSTNNTTLTPMCLNTAAPVFTTDPTPSNYTTNPLTGVNFRTFTKGSTLAGGTYHVGDAQVTLKKLTNVATLLNSSTLTGNVTFLMDADYDGTVGETLPITFNQYSTSGGNWTVTIRPDVGVTTRTTAGDPGTGTTVSLINFNGADNITFDGRAGGTGSTIAWIFRNTRTTATVGPTVIYQNDATNNTLTYMQVEGQSASINTGSIYFGTAATTPGATGNDNNNITFCSIRDRSDVAPGTGMPANGIYSLGTTTSLITYNSNINVSNNNIFNIFNATLSPTAGVKCETANSTWTINNNSFYHDALRTITTSAIQLQSILTVTTTSNYDFTINGNFFGGSAPLCAGSPMSFTSASGIGYDYVAIKFASTWIANATNIQGNTFRNWNMVNGTATTASLLRAVSCFSTGLVNVGDITGNTIGASTGNGSITVTTPFATTGSVTVIGVQHSGTGNVSNNIIGSITHDGITSSTGTASVQGINWANTPLLGFTFNCNNNVIGSLTTPNSIQNIGVTRGSSSRGIATTINLPGILNMNNNTISNFTEGSTSTTNSASLYAMQNSGTANTVMSGNTISNISDATGVSATIMVAGIVITGINAQYTCTQNTITGLRLTNPGAFVSPMYCIAYIPGVLGSPATVISRNKIYDITSVQTGGSTIVGIDPRSNCTVSNNMLSLTNGDASLMSNQLIEKTDVGSNDRVRELNNQSVKSGFDNLGGITMDDKNIPKTADVVDANAFDIQTSGLSTRVNGDKKNEPVQTDASATVGATIFGIGHFGTGQVNYYYNTIYVGGTQPGANTQSSATFLRQVGGAVVMRNNLFVNARTGGTGNHVVIANEIVTPPSLGWPASNTNYNVFLGSNATTIGEWGTGVFQTMSQWRTSSSCDANSWSTTTTDINPTSLFVNIATGNLNINTANSQAWLVSGKGLALTGQSVDFTGNSRPTTISGGCSDIGAHEFTATPPGNPVATQTGTPASGSSTSYSLWERNICTIDWGTGGTYPSSVNVNYFSGVNPLAPNVTNPQRTANSYWTATPVGSFGGTTYAITWNYSDNETFSITNPSTNIIQAKRDNSFWMSYPAGTGNLQSELNSGLFTVKTRGLFFFSSFTLTDAALPAEFPRSPLNNATNQPSSLTLVWSKSAVANTYRIQLATDSLFTTLVVNDSTVIDTTKLVSGLVNNTNYFWRVNGKNATGTGAWSQVFKFSTPSILPPALVNLKVIPGGFYNTGTGRLNMRDTVRAILVDSATCTRVDSSRIVIDSVSFTGQLSFANAPTGTYYLFIFHRNHIPVAARIKQTITRGSTVSYDFTTDSAKTYGFNAIKLAVGVWGMIPGDANRDQFVDGLDQTIWLLQNGLDGFLSADFNGDRFVDGLDQTLWLLYNGNSSFLPCNITEMDPIALEEFLKHQAKKLLDNQKAFELIQEAIKNSNINKNNNNTIPNGDVKNPVNNNGSDSKKSNTNKQNK